ncbi:MAG: HlyD family secretion protein [Solirubrobacterales bacterium]
MKKLMAIIFIISAVFAASCSNSTITLNGDIQNNIISSNSTVSGKIIEMKKQQGETVKKGDVIAIIDNTNQKYAVAQLKAMVEMKKAKLDELKAGTRPEQIAQAENNVGIANEALSSAKTSYDFLSTQYNNALSFYNKGYMSKNDLDIAKNKLDTSLSQLENAKYQVANANQQLSLYRKGSTAESIAAAQADLDQTTAQLNQAENTLGYYTITALADGIIISKNFELGDMVNVGSNIADVGVADDVYVLCYIPEKYIDKIYYGQSIQVNTSKGTQNGTVSYIALKNEYTPKDKQSANEGSTAVKIKIKIDDEKGTLKSGMTAKVTLPIK